MKRTAAFLSAGLMLCLVHSNKATAQNFCNNEATLWSENFGTGTGSASDPNIVNLSYQQLGVMNTPGTYRVIDYGDQNPNWHKTPDHTPNDQNGRMAVIDAKAGDIYSVTQTNANGYPAGFYSFNFWVLNLMGLGNCGPNSLIPVLRTTAEYQDANGNWVPMGNSAVTSPAIPETNDPVWLHQGGIFSLPATGNFIVTNMRFTISDLTAGGCGNDIALDDIKLSTCSDDGPVPVRFLNINAQKRGLGVNISWATGSEVNNDYFEVQRSTDAGATWEAVAKTHSAGNSSITKNYDAYDAKPMVGNNYYRIRQVDKDGTSKYSNTVYYRLTIDKTDVSVFVNPFGSNITLDFLSERNQVFSVRVFDNMGKTVINQQVTIAKGSVRKTFPASSLNRGMYVIQVIDDKGETMYTEKLIKQ